MIPDLSAGVYRIALIKKSSSPENNLAFIFRHHFLRRGDFFFIEHPDCFAFTFSPSLV
jgi:hypothetical protein